MSKILASMLALVAIAAGVYFYINSGGGEKKPSLLFFCAASNRAVMEEIRQAYEKEYDRRVEIQYGPSQTLLAQIEASGQGDLYLPADDSFLKMGRDKQIVEEILPIAVMQGGLVVSKGNPLQIESFQDLLRSDVRTIQANPEAAAIAKLTKKILSEQGLWESLDQATDAYRTTVTDVPNDLLVGAADTGIVYDAVLHTYPDLEFVAIPELEPARSTIAIGVLNSTKDPAAALHFARYVSATDRGLKHYSEHGFKAEQGDTWSDEPSLTIYAGSMLRPAIQETVAAFEKREGVKVFSEYNGCGILVAQMKGGHHPDAYFACDSEFMNQVVDLFPEPIDVSQNELVILVQKGNPFNIATLKDLTREGIRVGIGHEKQCAMGWITQNTFREGGIQQEVMENVKVQSPTGDMLVNQMLTDSLDAAVVYLSNAAGAGEKLDAIQIQGIECSTATQPWAVAKESKYPQLASRLFELICSSDSQDVFAAEGFRWQLQK